MISELQEGIVYLIFLGPRGYSDIGLSILMMKPRELQNMCTIRNDGTESVALCIHLLLNHLILLPVHIGLLSTHCKTTMVGAKKL